MYRAIYWAAQGGGGYSQKNWVGVCGVLPKTLTLFMAKTWVCRRLVDSVELSSTVCSFLLVTVSRISHLCPSFSGSSINLIQLRPDRLSMLTGCWASQSFLLVFVRFPVKVYGASIFLNKQAVDVFNKFLFFGAILEKNCLSRRAPPILTLRVLSRLWSFGRLNFFSKFCL